MEAEEEKQKTDKQLQNTRLLLIRVRSCSLIKYTHPIFEELPQAMSCFFEEDIVTLSGERCRVNNFVRHISSKYLKWTRNIRFWRNNTLHRQILYALYGTSFCYENAVLCNGLLGFPLTILDMPQLETTRASLLVAHTSIASLERELAINRIDAQFAKNDDVSPRQPHCSSPFTSMIDTTMRISIPLPSIHHTLTPQRFSISPQPLHISPQQTVIDHIQGTWIKLGWLLGKHIFGFTRAFSTSHVFV